MTQFAGNRLLKSIKKMYENRESDVNTDLVVLSKNGTETRVHSFILTQASEKLTRKISVAPAFKGSFEKIIQFPHGDVVVKLFVNFLYGFELLKNEVNNEVGKELLQMADVYEVPSLKDAVVFLMKDLLSSSKEENVFDMWRLSSNKKADDDEDKKDLTLYNGVYVSPPPYSQC